MLCSSLFPGLSQQFNRQKAQIASRATIYIHSHQRIHTVPHQSYLKHTYLSVPILTCAIIFALIIYTIAPHRHRYSQNRMIALPCRINPIPCVLPLRDKGPLGYMHPASPINRSIPSSLLPCITPKRPILSLSTDEITSTPPYSTPFLPTYYPKAANPPLNRGSQSLVRARRARMARLYFPQGLANGIFGGERGEDRS